MTSCTLETCEVVVGGKMYELNPRRKYLQHKVGNHHRFIARHKRPLEPSGANGSQSDRVETIPQ